ncbi:MAG: hypothetical protein ACI8XX_002452 [Polaribacter sp.]|jgi:hypothetical protein
MTNINCPLKYQRIILLLLCLNLNGAIAVVSNETDLGEIQWEKLTPLNWNPSKIFEDMTDQQYNALSNDELQRIEENVQAMFDAAPVNDELDGKRVKIPGFVLPLEFENTLLKEFLLVPYFGACTHTPPPPANQIIYAKLKVETELNNIYHPVWIIGTIHISRSNSLLNEAGIANGLEVQSAYSMSVESIEPYADEQ